MRYTKLIIFLCVLCTACVKEFDMDKIDVQPPKLVVNSFFTPDSVMKIHVSSSSSTKEKPLNITNAHIKLFKDGVLISQPQSIGNGWYNSYHFPEVNSIYEIQVDASGFESVYAKSSVPELPTYITPPIAKKVGVMFVDGDEKLVFNTHLSFKDIENQNNYYEFFFGSLIFTIHSQTDPSLLMDSDLDIKDYIPSLIFSDFLFKNQEKNLIIYGLGSVFVDEYSPEPVLHPFKLKFHSVSEEYYKYRKSANRHFYLQNTSFHWDDPVSYVFVGNPVDLYTNIHGGYGVFAGLNVQIITVNYE